MQPCLTRPTWEPLVHYAGLPFGAALLDESGCVLSAFRSWELTVQKPGLVWSADLDCLIETVAGRIHRFQCKSACLFRGYNLVGMCRARLEAELYGHDLSWRYLFPDDPMEMIAYVEELGVLFWVPERTETVWDVELISPGADHERRANIAAMHRSESFDDPWRRLNIRC